MGDVLPFKRVKTKRKPEPEIEDLTKESNPLVYDYDNFDFAVVTTFKDSMVFLFDAALGRRSGKPDPKMTAKILRGLADHIELNGMTGPITFDNELSYEIITRYPEIVQTT